jgi:hypothetical protein
MREGKLHSNCTNGSESKEAGKMQSRSRFRAWTNE